MSEPVSKPPAPPGHRLAAPDRHRRACKGAQPELRPAAAPGTTIRRPGGTDRFRDGFLVPAGGAVAVLARADLVEGPGGHVDRGDREDRERGDLQVDGEQHDPDDDQAREHAAHEDPGVTHYGSPPWPSQSTSAAPIA